MNDYIAAYLNGDSDEENLRCRFPVPWSKIIKKKLIEDYHIRFHETIWGNDIWFSAQVGCYAKTICVFNEVGYVSTVREGSLISDFCWSREEVFDRLQEALISERLFKSFGWGHVNKYSNMYLLITFRKYGFWWRLRFLAVNIVHWPISIAMGRFLMKVVFFEG